MGVSAAGTALMAAAVLGWRAMVGGGSLVVELFGALGMGVMVYVGLMWAAKVPELRGMAMAVMQRIKKSK